MNLPSASGRIPPQLARQRWNRLAIGVGVVAALVLGLLAYKGAKTLAHSKAGRRAVTLAPATPLPDTPVALLGTKSESGSLIALTAVALAAPGADGSVRGGYIIPLPVGSGIQVGSTPGLNRLAELYLSGGVQALADSAGALLAVNFSLVAETDRAALAKLLAPAGQVSVMKDGAQQNLDAIGGATLVTLQTTRLEGPHFDDVVAYWTALAKRVGKGLKIPGFTPPTVTTIGAEPAPGAATTAATLPSSSAVGAMARFMKTLMSGPITVYPLKGTSVPSGESNPNNLDVYKLDPLEVTRVFALAAPNAVSPIDANFTVTIVNPFGDAALTRAAIARMVAFGGAVTVVKEARLATAPAQTQFSLPGRLAKEDLKPFAGFFADNAIVPVGEPGTLHEHYSGADLTIVLGSSFKALIAAGGPAAAAPTTSTAAAVAPAGGAGS